MLRVLVPVDGSACSMRVISYLVAFMDKLRPALEVLLINIQARLPTLELMLAMRRRVPGVAARRSWKRYASSVTPRAKMVPPRLATSRRG